MLIHDSHREHSLFTLHGLFASKFTSLGCNEAGGPPIIHATLVNDGLQRKHMEKG